MKRQIISALIATSVALGALAPAPAIAGNDDLKRLLGGIATVVILGATIDHLRDKRQRPNTAAHVVRRPHKTTPPAKIVPAACFRRIYNRKGSHHIYGNQCLNQHMRNVNRLPNVCSIRLRTKDGLRNGFSAPCLRNHGWRRG